MTRRWRLVLIDDRASFRGAIRQHLAGDAEIDVVTDVESAEDVIELAWHARADVLMLDARMAHGGGLDAITAVRRISPGTRILTLITPGDDVAAERALRLGARSALPRDATPGRVVSAIREACGGETARSTMPPARPERARPMSLPANDRPELTLREREIIRLVTSGFRTNEVSATLAISGHTVKAHLTSIFQKLGVRDRVGLVARVVQAGIVRPS